VLLLFPIAFGTISFTSVAYLDDNTCHAECTVQFWWYETWKIYKEFRYHGVGTCLMNIYDSATLTCTKALITYIKVTVPATSPSLHLMNNHSSPRCLCFHIRHHHHYHHQDWMCIIMLSMTHGKTVSFQIFFLDIFNMFPLSLLVILYYKSHQVFSNL